MAKTRTSTSEWRAIARGPRVLHHIHTWRERDEDWSEQEFYALGRSDWEDFTHHWRHYWPELGGTCLEIGCGAGRITSVMAEDFDKVIAVDVSEDMIARAREVVPDNVEFVQVDDTSLPVPAGAATGVFTVHVLQHLDHAKDVAHSITEMARVLQPGGTVMIHIVLSSTPPGLFGRSGKIARELRLWRSRRGLGRGREHSVVRFRVYRAEEVEAMFRVAGFTDIELRVFGVRTNGDRHHFWFARKP